MAKELMEIGGFITEGAEIVNHDNTLSGDGTVDSPLGLNETVLWENTADKLTKDMSWPQTLSESISNFQKVKFLYGGDGGYAPQWFEFDVVNTNYTLTQSFVNPTTNNYCFYRNGIFSLNGTAFNNVNNYTLNYYGSTGMGDHNNVGYNKVSKIVGINRKAQ